MRKDQHVAPKVEPAPKPPVYPTALAVLIAERGWTLRQVSARSGVSTTAVMLLARGARKWPHGKTARKIAYAFGVHVEDLWKGICGRRKI